MISPLQRLHAAELDRLAGAIRTGRLAPPITALAITHCCGLRDDGQSAIEIQNLFDQSRSPAVVAFCLELLADERRGQERLDDVVDLVWSGPESPNVPARDTAVVLRQLFASALQHVLVVGYAVHQGKEVFRTLADQMESHPNLRVQMFLDIQRGHGDTTIPGDLVRRFAERFKKTEWPGTRMPDVYYDPRSLDMDQKKRSSMHAKCVVVDSRTTFVTSANFTEAAHERNIEVGVLIQSAHFATRVVRHFQTLAETGGLKPVPLSLAS